MDNPGSSGAYARTAKTAACGRAAGAYGLWAARRATPIESGACFRQEATRGSAEHPCANPLGRFLLSDAGARRARIHSWVTCVWRPPHTASLTFRAAPNPDPPRSWKHASAAHAVWTPLSR